MAASGADQVRFGIVLPTRDFIVRERMEDCPRIFALAERAEALGYESAWVGDSLLARPRLEALTTLAFVAGRTGLGIGTSVFLPPLREPVVLAYTLASLDLISGGRLTLGVGMGSKDPASLHEYHTVGVDPDRRVSRLEETLLLLRRLWTEEHVSFEGKHFHLDNVTVLPRPVRPRGPRLLLSVGNTGDQLSPRQLRRVLDLGDGIMPSRALPDEYARIWAQVTREAERAGRDPATLTPALYFTIHLDDDVAHAEQESEEFLLGYYPRNTWGNRWGPWGPASAIRERIDAFIEAGVRLFVVRFAAWDAHQQLERFTSEVFTHYR
ncbi:MAG TPA: LLM class flavin-dependent oxidoreductase [Chloroflexota bacterium]|jgi:alkanesulfonate monooxygenase SsuD/methylene tetrahydromethanopterin reductase-like flavin-dependent oxidoreductase (luciferase family)